MKLIQKIQGFLIAASVVLCTAQTNAVAQEGFHIGLEVNPSWRLMTTRSKTTGIWSVGNGYGFNVGLPIKWGYNEYRTLNTGVSFDYTAYDSYSNGVLVNSLRLQGIKIPLMIHFLLRNSWSLGGGIGANYLFRATALSSGLRINATNTINQIQPWLGFGVFNCMERDFGLFELGGQARYHVLNLYNKATTATTNTANRILAIDLVLRLYL